MTHTPSRRNVLAGAGAGAAATAVALTPRAAMAAGVLPSATSAQESVVAYVEDPKAGTVVLMVGERQVVVEDRELATRILNAAGGN